MIGECKATLDLSLVQTYAPNHLLCTLVCLMTRANVAAGAYVLSVMTYTSS